jgi:hypothetical protein
LCSAACVYQKTHMSGDDSLAWYEYLIAS